MFLYRVNLTPDDNDTFLVTSEDFRNSSPSARRKRKHFSGPAMR
jgi:hypothetical protein